MIQSSRLTNHFFTCFFILIVLSLTLFSCGDKVSKDNIATFDGGFVSKSEYVDHFLLSTRYKADVFPTRSNLEEIVRRKAFEKLVAVEARQNHLDQDSLFLALKKKNEQKIIYQAYTRRYLVSQVITDSLVQKYYREFSPQYNMRYIIRPFYRTSPPELIRSQQDTINHVYSLLKQGKNFIDLAKRYSQDISTRHKGGDLGYVIRESLGDEVLRAVMDTLKMYHYSAPVKGYEGFYILYKGAKREVTVPPFSEAEPNIRRSLAHNRQHVINNKIKAQFEKVKQDYNFRLNTENYNHVIKQTGGDPSGIDSQTLDFAKLTEADLLLTLATFDSDSFNVFAVLRELQRVPETLKQFREAVEQSSHRVVLAHHARTLGVDKIPEVEDEIKVMEISLLNSIYYEQNVKGVVRAKVDSIRESINLPQKEKAQYIRREGIRIEKELTDKLQDKLLRKYHFKIIEKNVASAMDEARARKIAQNAEQKNNS